MDSIFGDELDMGMSFVNHRLDSISSDEDELDMGMSLVDHPSVNDDF